MFGLVVSINCRHVCCILYEIADIDIRVNHVPQPPEENFGCYSLSGTCHRALETHVLLRFLWSIFYKWPVINFTLRTLEKVVHKIQVSNGRKFRSRYNQVPHLTLDTNGKVTNSQIDTTNESQEVSPFPEGDHKAHINRRIQVHSKHKTEKT